MKVQEIYESVHGELPLIGKPVTIVRLAGCNLHCEYCDAPEKPAIEMSIHEITDKVCEYGNTEVLITGGEPLLQFQKVNQLIKLLMHDLAFHITIETNGTINLLPLPLDVVPVMDVKLFNGGANDTTIRNLDMLVQGAVKFVYDGEEQLSMAIDFVKRLVKRRAPYMVIFSPINKDAVFIDKILKLARFRSDIDIRVQVQIHKYLNLA